MSGLWAWSPVGVGERQPHNDVSLPQPINIIFKKYKKHEMGWILLMGHSPLTLEIVTKVSHKVPVSKSETTFMYILELSKCIIYSENQVSQCWRKKLQIKKGQIEYHAVGLKMEVLLI